MQTLKTWAGRSEFSFEGTVSRGTEIHYGKSSRLNITANHYSALLNHFRGQTVDIGTSRDKPQRNSLGEWLQVNITKTATASYVGTILIHEGYQ
jgi:hypothetical protein